MDELNGVLLKMLEDGRAAIAAEEAAIELEHMRYAMEEERRMLNILEGLRSSIEETFPGLAEYVDWNGLRKNMSDNVFLSWVGVDVRIPGFAPILISYQIKPEIKYQVAMYAQVSHRSADFDEDGVEWNEYVVPFWSVEGTNLTMDFGVVLAKAQKQWEVMELAKKEWEVVKAELISNQQSAISGQKTAISGQLSDLGNEVEAAVHEAGMGESRTSEWGELLVSERGVALVSMVQSSDYVQGEDRSEGAWQEVANLLRMVVEMEVDRRIGELMDEEG